ncbi:hypothetical protein EVAR_57093_1 [Eumeta japonica]|uniref:Uncharacterized protein n=1 Tax=Eumeta variegata TaxID=151549 RepID=A0A4C1Z982_EUMVA|nr:hypothetical protein EVAR_57093_1 [Eumeta japonica]
MISFFLFSKVHHWCYLSLGSGPEARAGRYGRAPATTVSQAHFFAGLVLVTSSQGCIAPDAHADARVMGLRSNLMGRRSRYPADIDTRLASALNWKTRLRPMAPVVVVTSPVHITPPIPIEYSVVYTLHGQLIRTIGAAILALTALTSSGRECYSAADCNATCKRRRKSLRRCNKSFTLILEKSARYMKRETYNITRYLFVLLVELKWYPLKNKLKTIKEAKSFWRPAARGGRPPPDNFNVTIPYVSGLASAVMRNSAVTAARPVSIRRDEPPPPTAACSTASASARRMSDASFVRPPARLTRAAIDGIRLRPLG